MLRLLKIELFKLKFNRSAKVMSIIYFVLFTFTAVFSIIKFDIGPMKFQLADQGIFDFPFIWHFNTYFVAILKILLAVVIVSMIANEYSYRTLKQNLIDGLSKKEFILSKFYTIVFLSLASTLLVFIVSLVLGLTFSNYTEASIIVRDLDYLIAYFVKLVGFFSLCMFFSVLVRKSAFALGFLFLLFILEGILSSCFSYGNYDLAFLNQFLPLEAMANLIKEPFTRLNIVKTATSQLNPEFAKDYAVQWKDIIIVLVWTFLFVLGSLKILKRRDL
jgi:ABC-type transport system involved in multi-copper enzyme maturation permease subunit